MLINNLSFVLRGLVLLIYSKNVLTIHTGNPMSLSFALKVIMFKCFPSLVCPKIWLMLLTLCLSPLLHP